MTNKKREEVLNDFLGERNNEPNVNQPDSAKQKILDEREGLIERVDKVFITRKGKQLLREQY